MLEWLLALVGKLPLSDLVRRGLDRIPFLDLDRAKASRAHDSERFRQLDAVLPEPKLERFLTDAYNLSIPEISYQPVWDALAEFQSIQHELINPQLERHRKSFLASLEELTHFLGVHVFARGSGSGHRFVFLPEANPDYAGIGNRREKHFHERRDELYSLIAACESQYKEFRREIKRQLLI